MNKPNIDIEKKQSKLNKVKAKLKKYFVGLDDIIDKLIRNLEVWYIFPELLTRPTIINLWGLTGVGKTDLVRKLIDELEMEDAFLEIQLKQDTTGYEASIQDDIQMSGITSNKQGVLLLDELQRFSTIAPMGDTIENKKYDDIWALLSDGKFSDSNKERDKLYGMMISLLYTKDRDDAKVDKLNKADDDDEPVNKGTNNKQFKYKSSAWEAESFKRKLDLSLSLEDIMLLSADDKIDIIEERLYSTNKNNKKVAPKVYSKLLIIVCGNLDEAYSMSDDVSDVDIDADILHAFSKSISVLNIKDALQKKFKPEQIARLGNTHIIYPSLSKKNYEDIIELQLNSIIKTTFNRTKINVNFTDKLKSAIYRNGVFPAQGTRPLFSTINSIVENSIPEFLMQSKINKITEFIMDVHVESHNNYVVSIINGTKYTRPIELELDYLKYNITKDMLSIIAPHESGHAVAYSLLFGVVPAQVVGNSIGSHSSGFMAPHNMTNNKTYILNKVQVLLAGLVCEELIFGEGYKTNGCEHDVSQATKLLCQYVRQWSMDGTIGTIFPITLVDQSWKSVVSIEKTDTIIEQLLTEQKSKVKDLLQKNVVFLKEIIKETLKLKKLMPVDFYKIAVKYMPHIMIKKHDYVLTHTYDDSLQKFLSN